MKRMVEGGCDFGQGFYFSDAVPADRVAGLIARSTGPAKATGTR